MKKTSSPSKGILKNIILTGIVAALSFTLLLIAILPFIDGEDFQNPFPTFQPVSQKSSAATTVVAQVSSNGINYYNSVSTTKNVGYYMKMNVNYSGPVEVLFNNNASVWNNPYTKLPYKAVNGVIRVTPTSLTSAGPGIFPSKFRPYITGVTNPYSWSNQIIVLLQNEVNGALTPGFKTEVSVDGTNYTSSIITTNEKGYYLRVIPAYTGPIEAQLDGKTVKWLNLTNGVRRVTATDLAGAKDGKYLAKFRPYTSATTNPYPWGNVTTVELKEGSNFFIYENKGMQDPQVKGRISSASGGASSDLVFRQITSKDFGYTSDTQGARELYRTSIARFATDGEVKLSVTLPSTPQWAELRSATGVITTSIDKNIVNFKLPAGSGVYYMKTSVDLLPSTSEESHDTIVFWVDDMDEAYLTPPSGSKVLTPGQSIKNTIKAMSSGTIYLSAGTYDEDDILIEGKNNLTLILHPNAVILQPFVENKDFRKNILRIANSSNIKLKGPGELRGAKGNGKRVIEIDKSNYIELDNFFLYKIHHREGYITSVTNSNNIVANNVKIIGGNDGFDPDGSTYVTLTGMYIETQDDGVAIKTISNESHHITFQNGIVRSAASALKIGEAYINKGVYGIKFINSTVFDSDRALAIIPRGTGLVGDVLFSNIRVRNMIDDTEGVVIRVEKSEKNTWPGIFEGSNIVFEKIDAYPIKQSTTKHKITIKDSTFTSNTSIKLFGDVCPNLINFKANWTGVPGSIGCPVQ
ncbi:MAG: hypothetical protein QG570_95 [Patescibacteria group bacterium]|nr:hypothetical protein [Patescibacteria group bacterium]